MSAESSNSGPAEPAFARRKRFSGCCVYWRSPFFVAVEEGDIAEVARFLREDVRWLKQADKKERRTAWHIAAANGHVEVLRTLVDRTRDDDVGLGWNSQATLSSRIRAAAAARDAPGPEERVSELVNGRASWGVTPLAVAAERDHLDVVKYLLSVGADPWLGDAEGCNPAHYAAKAGAIRALQVLLEEEKPLTARACSRNHPGTRYVDSLDAFGFTPLHYATWANRKPAMMLLIGFDANIITRSLMLHTDYYNLPAGSTPLHIACLLGDLDRVKLLLRAYYETAADLLPSQTALLGTLERRRRARSHPDPRLVLTRTSRLPFHIAARAGHRHLLDWLDPSVPLMFLFGGEEEGGAAGGGREVALVGVSRLTVIAAKALHQALLGSLDEAAEDIRRHQEEQAARRRRREERRLAREAEEAAQSLKQGKEPPPDGFRSRIRRMLERASKDGDSGGAGATAAFNGSSYTADPSGRGGGSEAPTTGWRPWRNRGARRARRKVTGSPSGTGDGAAAAGADGGQQQRSGALRSPRRRRRRSALGLAGRVGAGTSGGGVTTARVALASAAAGTPGAVPQDDSNSSSGDDEGEVGGAGGGQSPKQPSEAQQQPLQPPPPRKSGSGNAVLNRSLRLRIFQSSNSQASQHRPSNTGREPNGAAATDTPERAGAVAGSAAEGGSSAAMSPVGAGGGMASGLTRTMLQRLYIGSLRRQGSGASSSDLAQAQLNERLNRAGIAIPEGPDEAVAYFMPGREPRYNIPTQILLPASAFGASLRTSETEPSPTSGRPSRTTLEASTATAVAETATASDTPAAADSTAGATVASGEQGAEVADASPGSAEAGTDMGARCGGGSEATGDGGAAKGEGGYSAVAGAVTYTQRVSGPPTRTTSAVSEEGVECTRGSNEAQGAAVAAAGMGPGAGTACDSKTDPFSMSTKHSVSCRRGPGDAFVDGVRACGGGEGPPDGAVEGAAADVEAVSGERAAGAFAAADPGPLRPAGSGPLPESDLPGPGLPQPQSEPHAQATDFTSLEQVSGDDLFVAAASPRASEAAPSPSRPRPGSAAAPLRPWPSPLAAPSGNLEETPLLAPHPGEASAAAADLDLDRSSPRHPGRKGDLSPAEAGPGAGTIRSAGASRVPSRRPSLQLPGAAARASGSGLPSPSSLLPSPTLPPPLRQLSGEGGAAATATTSHLQLLEGLAQLQDCPARLERGAASADGAVAVAIAMTAGDDGATAPAAADGGWAMSSGMGRMGAGALHLLNSLRSTLRRTSGQHTSQVVPVTRSPRSPSPGRRFHHHHHYRRTRTPDSSVRAGRSPGRSPATAGAPGSPARLPGDVLAGVGAGANGGGASAGGADGKERDAAVPEAPRSPTTSYQRGSAYSHQHNLAARGVRVASGRPHARLSLFSRASLGNQAQGAAASGGVAPGATRRCASPSRLLATSTPQAEAEVLAGQGDAEGGGAQSASEPEAQAQMQSEAEADPAADAAAAGNGGAGGKSLCTGDTGAAASSFSSTSSREGAAAATAGGDEEDVCPVCLDEAPNLLVQKCRHQICMDCARDLTKRHVLTPALCPYCRGIISSFKARVAAELARQR